MGVGDDQGSKQGVARDVQPYGKLVTPSGPAAVAKGSDRFHRDRVHGAATVPVENLVVLDPDDKKTRKMEAEQFKQLLKDERAKPAEAPKRNQQSTAELMATVDDAFAEFADPPANDVAVPTEVNVGTESKPVMVKKQALIVEDHRLETRFAGAIPPITKPPAMREATAPKTPPMIEPIPSSSRMLILVSVLVVAVLVAIALVLVL